MGIKLYPRVEEQLIDIWNYTSEQWGESQADSYVREMVTHMHSLAKTSYQWKPVPDAELSGIFYSRCKHHFIFFKQLSKDELGVISVLHEKMNIPQRLIQDTK